MGDSGIRFRSDFDVLSGAAAGLRGRGQGVRELRPEGERGAPRLWGGGCSGCGVGEIMAGVGFMGFMVGVGFMVG